MFYNVVLMFFYSGIGVLQCHFNVIMTLFYFKGLFKIHSFDYFFNIYHSI